MKYDGKKIYGSLSKIMGAKNILKEAKIIVQDINGIIDSKNIKQLNNVIVELDRIIADTQGIEGLIYDAINTFEVAEKNNLNLLNGNGTLRIRPVNNPYIIRPYDSFDDGEDYSKHTYTPAYSFSNIPKRFKRQCPQEGYVIDVEGLGTRGIQVYLPYDYSTDKQYNVVVLAHGLNGTEEDWLSDTKISQEPGFNGKTLLDNMIYYGLSEPVIVVSISYRAGNNMNYDEEVNKMLKNEVLPYVATNFSTYATCSAEDSLEAQQQAIIDSRDHFAIAGASQGGILVEHVLSDKSEGPSCSDFFSSYGCFAGYNPNIEVTGEKDINNLYFAVGEWDYGDGAGLNARHIMESAYKSAQGNDKIINSELDIMIKAGHEWPVWYTSLYNFLQITNGHGNNSINPEAYDVSLTE